MITSKDFSKRLLLVSYKKYHKTNTLALLLLNVLDMLNFESNVFVKLHFSLQISCKEAGFFFSFPRISLTNLVNLFVLSFSLIVPTKTELIVNKLRQSVRANQIARSTRDFKIDIIMNQEITIIAIGFNSLNSCFGKTYGSIGSS